MYYLKNEYAQPNFVHKNKQYKKIKINKWFQNYLSNIPH